MSNYNIGRVISVSGDNITIGLLETSGASGHGRVGVPEDMAIRVPVESGAASAFCSVIRLLCRPGYRYTSRSINLKAATLRL